MLVAYLIRMASQILQDKTHVLWTLNDLIDALNAATYALASIRPDSMSTIASVALTAGTKQAIPKGGIRLLNITRNMGANGIAPGKAITLAQVNSFNLTRPGWHTDKSSTIVRHFLFDNRAPKDFYVWPPALASGGVVGSKLDDPEESPASTSWDIAWSPNGKYLAIAHEASPYLTVWDFTDPENLVKFDDPADMPAGDGIGIAWSPDGAHVGVAHSTTPFVSVYPFSSGGFGTKIADPATLPAGNGQDITWSPDGLYLGVAHVGSPFLSVYPFSSGVFGAKIADPATLPTGNSWGFAWSPGGDHMGVVHGGFPHLTIYHFSKTPWVEMVYSREPTMIPLTIDASAYDPLTQELDVSGTFVNPLLEFMLFRAYMKDGKTKNEMLANQHLQQFYSFLGFDSQKAAIHSQENRDRPYSGVVTQSVEV